MEKCVLSLFIKLALFAVIMVLVALSVPYEGLVNYLTGFFDFQRADKFTHFILGEPDQEVWESLRSYSAILINTLISIPLFSAVITAYNAVSRKISLSAILKEWVTSTLRRCTKLFAFIFLFWAFFRTLPYHYIFPDSATYPVFSAITVVVFNLLTTIACYWFITKKIAIKRSL